jgi:hypothetical protein
MAVLHLKDKPKMLDWCLQHRRGSFPSGVNGAFRNFILQHCARLAASSM